MEMSISRKVLNVAGIIDYIVGSLSMIICALMLVAGALIAFSPEAAANVPGGIGTGTALAAGALLGFEGIFSFCSGYVRRKAGKDPSKIMPAWILSLVLMLINVLDVVINFVQHVPFAEMGGEFTSLAIAILLFVVANNVKKERNTKNASQSVAEQ